MISTARYWFYIALIVLVYIIGMFVTLFENDSAQFAVMAMRMVQENDFLNLFKGTEEYLDKPHMHYWLAALSYKIFGIHDWAYRIPGILSTLLGAYSCYGLGKLLYNKEYRYSNNDQGNLTFGRKGYSRPKGSQCNTF